MENPNLLTDLQKENKKLKKLKDKNFEKRKAKN